MRRSDACAAGDATRATGNNELWPLIAAFVDPLYDPVRRSARFQALLRRLGIGQ